MDTIYRVKTCKKPVDWEVEVPGSKSMTNRALLMAAIASGRTKLKGVLFSDDSRYFLSSLQSLGFQVEIDEAAKTVTVEGCGGVLPVTEGEIYVGSAGTAARFLTAMLSLSKGTFVIQASEQMKKRPMKPLFDVLTGLGAKILYLEEEGFLPIQITGIGEQISKEKEVTVALDISKSTQFLSALLLTSPMIAAGIRILITSEKTDGAYIRITRKMMEQFGVMVSFDGRNYVVKGGQQYQIAEYQIEPDVSAACYFYGAAAITGGRALVKNVTKFCMQGDLKFLTALEQIGCKVTEDADGQIVVLGPANGAIDGITVDMNDFSDQTMTLAAMAPFAKGKVRIEHIGHIRLQESDRIHAIATELNRLGIDCTEEEDALTILPGTPKPGGVTTYEDHRMAMAFSLIGLRTEGIVIKDPDCCRKTFEQYFSVLDRLCEQNNEG
ncbi:MAG: 3-phosphoshikimate 1-carboxyvinyltransferase [Roseburia sp.]|nr:3-phosphoshikimate 1-carboxyvinyltransferase [Roseburia sp.]